MDCGPNCVRKMRRESKCFDFSPGDFTSKNCRNDCRLELCGIFSAFPRGSQPRKSTDWLFETIQLLAYFRRTQCCLGMRNNSTHEKGEDSCPPPFVFD